MGETEQTRLAGAGNGVAAAEAVAGDGGRDARVVDLDEERFPAAEDTLKLAVTQVDYTIAGSGRDERPIVHVFGRRPDTSPTAPSVHVRVHDFEPYFYTPTATLDDAKLDRDVITRAEDGYEGIRGEALTKVCARTPRDVGQIRDEFDHFEADVLFPNRLLIDKDIQSGIEVPDRRVGRGKGSEGNDGTESRATSGGGENGDERIAIDVHHEEITATDAEASPRVLTFDIEVDDRSGFPEEGEETILCLTSHDSGAGEYTTWLYESPTGEGITPGDLADYEPIEAGGPSEFDVSIRAFDSEEAMLEAFVEYVRRTDPDVMTGWNFGDFDAPYLLDRLEELGGVDAEGADLDPDRLSRVDEVWRSGWQGPNIKGRVVFDLLYAYQRTQFSELDSYRLDAVGEVELGVGKERYAGSIGDLWESDPERLLEYNLRDVELCVEIDRQQDVIAFWREVAAFVGCKLEDAPTPGDVVDMYVLHEVHGELVLPSKGRQDTEDYEGGAVFDPITGVRENVAVLDLASLYPMSMVTINASPETKVDPETYDGRTYRAPNGTHFRRKPDGIIRQMVDDLLDERERFKRLRSGQDHGSYEYVRYDRQQSAIKRVMNSLYGVAGWDRFRLYDKEFGAAVTATGRAVLEFTEEAANEFGYGVAYGDSVTGDRPVVVRDPEGLVRILPIADLFDRAERAVRSEVLITADGGPVASTTPRKERRTLDGWEALSVSPEGESEWQPIEQAIRHRSDKPVVRLQHKFGESTTTEDHAYVTADDGELVETAPEEVDEPLRVPGLPEVSEIGTIDVYEALRGYEREYEDGRSVGTESAVTKTKRIHADEEYVWFGHEHHRDLRKTTRVKRYIDVGSEDGRALCRLLGAYASEGSASTIETTNSKFGVSIAESRPEWLDLLREDCHRLFENTTANVITSDTRDERTIGYETATQRTTATYDDRTKKLQMMNELAAVFFREFAGQTSRGKRVPSLVFHLPTETQDVFLKTLIEGDGSREFPRYTAEYAERNFDFETVSRELAAGLSILLTQRERKHSLKYRESKGSYTVRTCGHYRSGRDPVLIEVEHDGCVYDLSVEKNENFVDGVGGIVLHNTDSVMLELGQDVTTEEAVTQAEEIATYVNGSYDAFAEEELGASEHRFEIEFEKLYRRFFQAGRKKRYAGHVIWKDGREIDDVDITGFEYKRSDIAPITKRVQHDVIERVVYGEDLNAVSDYVRTEIEHFENGEVDLEEVGIPGGIGKRLNDYDTDTAQVRGAKYANLLLGTNFQRGSKPKRLYLDRVHPDFFDRIERERADTIEERPDLYEEFKRNRDVICFEYADEIPAEFSVDWGKMLEKTLQGPIARVLDALDISWNEVKSGQTQTGLGSFV
jgi:DNA polymerase I